MDDRYCWFCGQKMVESYGFTSKCASGHVWYTDGGDTPDEPLVLLYKWAESDVAKPYRCPHGCDRPCNFCETPEDVDANPEPPSDGPAWPLR